MATKPLSMIHLTRGMQLVETLEKPETQLELLAVYLAPVQTLIKARHNPEVMEDLIAQAAELSGEEGGELLADFMAQFGKYSASLVNCGLLLTQAIPELPKKDQTQETT